MRIKLLLAFFLLVSSVSAVIAQAPVISSFSPATGTAGSLVTLSGTGFSNVTGFSIGGSVAIVISNTGTQLVGMVMPGAVTGTVSLTTTGGSAVATGSFTVVPIPAYTGYQQNNRLVSTGYVYIGGPAGNDQVAVSADGSTAIVGSQGDNSDTGASWVYTRTGNTWTQQGSKLVGKVKSVGLTADGNIAVISRSDVYNGSAPQGEVSIFTRNGSTWSTSSINLFLTGSNKTLGNSVAISADGSTIAATGTSNSLPAVYTFVRSGNTWVAESTFAGTGMVGTTLGSMPISISANGGTLIYGVSGDNNNQGAAWIFARNNGGAWVQQGTKMVGTGSSATAQQGISVAMSADATTAIVGASNDNSAQGAAFIYSYSLGAWTQQGSKLVGTGNFGTAQQGTSVAITADGNRAIIGGSLDNTYSNGTAGIGASWIFDRSGTTWAQRGNKIVGAQTNGIWQNGQQGYSTAINADGNIAVVAGYFDNYGQAWVFNLQKLNPTVSTTAATAIGLKGATLNGTVNDNGSNTLVSIDYGTTSSLGSTTNVPITTGTNPIVSGTGTVSFTGVLTGLTPATTYYYRISATNSGGTSYGATQSFTTISTAITNPATAITSTTATLNGVVNDNGAATTVTMEYGTAADLTGSTTAPLTTGTSPVGVGTGNVSFTSALTGLTAGTTYYFRINAVTSAGTTRGDILSFTTVAQPPVITSFSPATGPVGSLITVLGSNLSNITSITTGGVQSIIISKSAGQVVAMVMPGTPTGSLLITTPAGSVTSTTNFAITATPYPSAQVGNKVASTSSTGGVQGMSVAISADGNTTAIGSAYETNTLGAKLGAIWVFTKVNGIWVQQGNKLVPSGGLEYQMGASMAISADGNTIITGAFTSNATWVFTRTAGVWAQQGGILVGNDAVGSSSLGGVTVGLSADGNTGLIGWQFDNSSKGAAWIFNRNNNVWTQTGSKLVGTGTVATRLQGISVGLSADGLTAATGGANNVVVYTYSGGIWAQQGSALTGSANMGQSTALSADGNTLISGDPIANSQVGGAFIFTRSGTTWSQQSTLTGSDAVGTANLGRSVAISADGNTAIAGGFFDNNSVGATWVYTRSGTTWSQQGSKLVGAGYVKATGTSQINQGLWVALSANAGTAIIGGPGDSPLGAAWIFSTAGSKSSQALTLVPFSILTYGWVDIAPVASSTNSSIPITFTSSNTAVATVTSGGNLHIVGAGTTTITASQAGNTYFDPATPVTQTLTVNPNVITVTAANQTKVYGTVNPTLTVSYSGFVNGDTQASFTTAATATTTATLTSPVGTYPITAAGATSANYTFNYVAGTLSVTPAPAPTITSFTAATATTGNTVTITGTNLLGATAVSFGGTAASSFMVVSPTSITAVVGVGASGNVSVTTPTGTGVLAGFNYVFSLPASTFKLTNTSATCKGSSNGSVNITAVQPYSGQTLNYVATITGNGLNTPYPFTTTTDITNLAAGTYNICLTVTGQTGYQQCFTVVITEPKDLSLYSSVSKGTNQVVLSMGGSLSYNISLNGSTFTTSSQQVTLQLKNGVNNISVSTDKICQGEITKQISIGGDKLVYPNPFENTLSVTLGDDNIKTVVIKVFDAFSRVVYTKQYANQSGVLTSDLSGLIPGVYMLDLSADNKETVFKIIKK